MVDKLLKEIPSEAVLVTLLISLLCGFQIPPAGSSEAHDVAVTDVVAWPSMVAPGMQVHINVTAENQGASNESFMLSVYMGDISVRDMTVDLTPSQIKTVALVWEIPGTMWAYIFQPPLWDTNPMIEDLPAWAKASMVAGEVDTSDNIYVDGSVTVIWRIGDVDGNGVINIFDIVKLAGCYGSELGDPGYDPLLDYSQNGRIDIFDIVAAASSYGAQYL